VFVAGMKRVQMPTCRRRFMVGPEYGPSEYSAVLRPSRCFLKCAIAWARKSATPGSVAFDGFSIVSLMPCSNSQSNVSGDITAYRKASLVAPGCGYEIDRDK
jgi:hypothetical protein